jgi:hypothetical protein
MLRKLLIILVVVPFLGCEKAEVIPEPIEVTDDLIEYEARAMQQDSTAPVYNFVVTYLERSVDAFLDIAGYNTEAFNILMPYKEFCTAVRVLHTDILEESAFYLAVYNTRKKTGTAFTDKDRQVLLESMQRAGYLYGLLEECQAHLDVLVKELDAIYATYLAE